MNVIVDVKGLPELNARLSRIANGSKEAMQNGAMTTMLRVVREAKQLCAVRTGNLRSSIIAGKLEDGAYASAGGGNGLKDVRYAVYVEYGTGIYAANGNGRQTPWTYFDGKSFHRTRGSRPHPYFVPAVEASLPFAEQDMKVAVDKLIEAS